MSRSTLSVMIHSDDDDEEDEEEEEAAVVDTEKLSTKAKALSTSDRVEELHDEATPQEEGSAPLNKDIIKQNDQVITNKNIGEELAKLVLAKSADLKIPIRFQPVGSTPLITPRVFKIAASQTMASLSVFLRRRLKLSDLLWLYLHSLFSPNPDERLGDLWEMFRTNDELVVYYCNTVAFG